MPVTKIAAIAAAAFVAVAGAVFGQIPLELTPTVDVLVNEYGPLGIAVFVLYRRVDRLEDRIVTTSNTQDDIEGTMRDLDSRVERIEDQDG